MPELNEYIQPFRDWLGVAVPVGLTAAGLAFRLRRRGEQLLPPQRWRAVPWSGTEILAALLIAHVILVLFAVPVVQFNLVRLLYNAETTDLRLRGVLWAALLAAPSQVCGTLLLLHLVSGTQLYQFGWTAQRLAPNILLGLLAWLLATPLVLCLFIGVVSGYEVWFHLHPEQHPVSRLLQSSTEPADWFMTILTVIVVAPLLEELQFRGLIQGWATRRTWRADLVMVLSLVLAVLFRGSGLVQALLDRSWSALLLELHPALFVLAVAPIYLGLRARNEHGMALGSGLFAAALFFAIFHTGVWPTPIPLLALGLILGWLAHRTQSLVAPMVMHALFNAVAMVGMLHQDAKPAPPPEKGSAVTWTTPGTPATSAVNVVPNASCPRRT